MRQLTIEFSRYTFIDYGSGKGRVLLLAARYPFRRVIGVEMSAALNLAAAANIAAYERRNPLQSRIELVAGDARNLAVPDEDLVAYFYNPFDEVVLRAVWDKLRASIMRRPRSLFVVYVNPMHRRLFDDSNELRWIYDEPAVVVYRANFS